MEDLEEFVINYVKQQEFGTLKDIIGYLSSINIGLQQSLSELKKVIIELLKRNDEILYSEDFGKFEMKKTKGNRILKNEFYTHQNILLGRIVSDKKIAYINFSEDFYKKISQIGHLKSQNKPNDEYNLLRGILDLNVIQISFLIDQEDFQIKSMMKKEFITNDPLMEYLFQLEEGISKQYSAFIPLNFGLYLILEIFIDLMKKNYPDVCIQVDSVIRRI